MDNNEQLTTRQFNKLLHMAVDKYGLDPKNTYVEITWWDNIFRPLDITDCNRNDSSNILVFGDTTCNSYKPLANSIVFPVGFWIWNEAIHLRRAFIGTVKTKRFFASMLKTEILANGNHLKT